MCACHLRVCFHNCKPTVASDKLSRARWRRRSTDGRTFLVAKSSVESKGGGAGRGGLAEQEGGPGGGSCSKQSLSFFRPSSLAGLERAKSTTLEIRIIRWHRFSRTHPIRSTTALDFNAGGKFPFGRGKMNTTNIALVLARAQKCQFLFE